MDDTPITGTREVAMTEATRAMSIPPRGIDLKLHIPAEELTNSARWLINGFPATILVWTADEWSKLIDRPRDAQPVANGTWCALRID